VQCFEGAALQVAAAKHNYCHNTPASSAVAQPLVEQANPSIATDLNQYGYGRIRVGANQEKLEVPAPTGNKNQTGTLNSGSKPWTRIET
jgi:hypothetical protein